MHVFSLNKLKFVRKNIKLVFFLVKNNKKVNYRPKKVIYLLYSNVSPSPLPPSVPLSLLPPLTIVYVEFMVYFRMVKWILLLFVVIGGVLVVSRATTFFLFTTYQAFEVWYLLFCGNMSAHTFHVPLSSPYTCI